MLWVHGEIDGANIRTTVQDEFSALTAVLSPVDTTLRVRAEAIPECRDVDELGVGRMDSDMTDVVGSRKTEMAPGLAAIVRLVDAVVVGDVAAQPHSPIPT